MIQGEGGFVRDYRSTVDWEWFTDVNTAHLWEYIRLRVNYEPSRFRGMEIQRGEMIESIDTMAKKTGLSYKQVRTALNHLKKTGEIECQRARYGMLIKVIKYDIFQYPITTKGTQMGNEGAISGQLESNEGAMYKEDKEIKKKKKVSSNTEVFTPPTLDEIREYAKSEQLQLDAEKFLHFNEKKGWIEKDWKFSVRQWCKKDQEFQKARPRKKDELPVWYDTNPKRTTGEKKNTMTDEEIAAVKAKLSRMRGGQ